MARRLVPGPPACGVIAFLLLLALPRIANPYFLLIGNELTIYVILSLGLNLLVGYCGQLAFAQAALFGIGAYGTGLLRVHFGLPFMLALPAGTVIATIIGLLMAFPALRLSGHYLALSTLAFAEFTTWVFEHWDAVTYGGGGFRVALPAATSTFSPADIAYYTALLLAALLLLVSARLVRSRIGRAMMAVRDGEVAAESLGISLLATKAVAFGLSAAFAGIAGGLFAMTMGFVSPESFDLTQMVLEQAMIVAGGLGSIAGSAIGAGILIGLQEGLRAFQSAQEIAFGAVLLGVVVLAPRGVAGFLGGVLPGWQERYLNAPAAIAEPVEAPAETVR